MEEYLIRAIARITNVLGNVLEERGVISKQDFGAALLETTLRDESEAQSKASALIVGIVQSWER